MQTPLSDHLSPLFFIHHLLQVLATKRTRPSKQWWYVAVLWAKIAHRESDGVERVEPKKMRTST
jgi:hypothetical protein